MKKHFSIGRSVNIGNKFMARGLGGKLFRKILAKIIRVKSYLS